MINKYMLNVNPKYIIYYLFIICLHIINCKPPNTKPVPKAINGILDLRQWEFTPSETNDGTINLDGEWEFYWGEFYCSEDFANPNKKDEIERSKEYMKVPGTWHKGIHKSTGQEFGSEGFATYRVIVKNNSNYAFTHIKIRSVFSAYKMYVNGNLVNEVGKIGKTDSDTDFAFSAQVIPIGVQSQDIEIIFHVSNYTLSKSGLVNSPEIGTEEILYSKYIVSLGWDTFLFGSLLIMSLYHIGLFLRRRTDTSPLYFALFSFCFALRPLLIGDRFYLKVFESPQSLFVLQVEYMALYVSLGFFVLFIQKLFPDEIKKYITYPIALISFLLALFVFFPKPILFTKMQEFFQILVLISSVYIFYIIILASIRRRIGAISFFLGFLFFFLTIINDILYNRNLINTGHFSSLGVFVFIFSQAYLLSIRFSNAFAQVEKAKEDSEEQRTLLEQAKLEIENLSRTKDEFLSNLSHEIKTPLSVVYTYSQMLPNQKENPKKIEKYADQIYANASKLNDYVSDLLLVTDIESNLELQKSNVSLKALLEESISPLSGLLEEKSISLEMSEIPEISLECDPVLLKKAIQAVLKNAIVYNKKEGIVKIGVQIKSDVLNLHITDTGIGIETGQLKKVFEKFWRGNSSLTYEVSGVGVGLFLAKRILELHGGSILVVSEIDKGSTFVLSVPCESSDF
jgi:signal transduction histidine kinase